MRTTLAILFGKSIAKTSRTLKLGGGSAAPGLYALRIDPNLILKLITKIPRNVVITGTNGKTTTARLLAHFAKTQNLKVIRNHTGSNLERGIVSTLLTNHGKKYDLGIWELDEAAFNTVVPKINPDLIVFLNVYRDQLDRYGEVDTVVKGWRETLANHELKATVLVNRDDPNLLNLKHVAKGSFKTFGVSGHRIIGEVGISPKRIRQPVSYESKQVKLNGLQGSTFQLKNNQVNLPIPGLYHIYDATAALAIASELGLSLKKATKNMRHFSPAFGRVEKFTLQPPDLQHKVGYIFLIKNPKGATLVFETIAKEIKANDRLLLALNDNLADGTDVSWIWDANFEELQNSSRAESRDYTIYTSGTRAYDLANRLKYAGFDTNMLEVEPDLKKAFKRAQNGLKGRLFILPTYTAMLELQKILSRLGVKKHYWEEEFA